LKWSDVALSTRDDGVEELTIQFTRRKQTEAVDQYTSAVISAADAPDYCAVYHYKLYRKKVISDGLCMFPNRSLWLRYNSQSGRFENRVIGRDTLAKIPRSVATDLGLDAEKFSSHSIRRTAATLGADAGLSKVNLKRAGGWKSDKVVERYFSESTNLKREASSIMFSSQETAPAKGVPNKRQRKEALSSGEDGGKYITFNINL
jgi:integrase